MRKIVASIIAGVSSAVIFYIIIYCTCYARLVMYYSIEYNINTGCPINISSCSADDRLMYYLDDMKYVYRAIPTAIFTGIGIGSAYYANILS